MVGWNLVSINIIFLVGHWSNHNVNGAWFTMGIQHIVVWNDKR